MKNTDYWKKFEQTGNVFDYLNYTACTTEEFKGFKAGENEEGGYIGDSIICDGDSFIIHAHRGL